MIDEAKLERNLKILETVRRRAGVRYCLRRRRSPGFDFYPLVAKYLDGTTASGLFEARLAHEEMPGREYHVFNPAFSEKEMEDLVKWCDHIVFNSVAQWKRFRDFPGLPSAGLRVNPGYSEIEHAIYNPCAPGSRLGVPRKFLDGIDWIDGMDGLHFHTMCEQGRSPWRAPCRTLRSSSASFCSAQMGQLRRRHHITTGHDISLLVKTLKDFPQASSEPGVYLEPGEAIALNAGTLVASVREIIDYDVPIAILDVSAECHMPDVIEMPYRPPVKGSGQPGEKRFTYRFGGPTCLAGDVIGDYSFAHG